MWDMVGGILVKVVRGVFLMYEPKNGKGGKFTTDRQESCTAKLTIRIEPSVMEKLKQVEGWQESVRQFIKANLIENDGLV